MIYLLIFLGFLLHVLSKVFDALKKKISPIDWIKMPKNYLYVIISAISCVTLAFIVDFSGVQDFDILGVVITGAYAVAFVVGWMNNSIIRALLNKFIKEKNVSVSSEAKTE